MCLVNLVSWQQGLVLAPGNPLGLGPRDIGRSGIRVAWREPGSGAHDLLLRLLGAERTDVEPGPGGSTWDGHMDVARAVAAGLADVGIAIEPAAAAFGLAFVPLAAERFDLVVPRETLEAPAIRRLLDAIDSRVFRADAASVGGYETSLTGHMTRLEPGSLLP
jgi:putative molybdopterin biosynthesis protein